MKLRKFKSGGGIEKPKVFDTPTNKEISFIAESMRNKNYGEALAYSGLSQFKGDLQSLIGNNPRIQELINQLNLEFKKELGYMNGGKILKGQDSLKIPDLSALKLKYISNRTPNDSRKIKKGETGVYKRATQNRGGGGSVIETIFFNKNHRNSDYLEREIHQNTAFDTLDTLYTGVLNGKFIDDLPTDAQKEINEVLDKSPYRWEGRDSGKPVWRDYL